MIDLYLKLVLKRPLLPIIGLAVLTIFLGLGLLKIQFDSSIESYMPRHDPEFIEYSETKAYYGDNDRFILMGVTGDPLWSAGTFAAIDRLLRDIEEYQDFREDVQERRLARFRTMNRYPAAFETMAVAFSDDPEFVRFLERKTPENARNKPFLSKKDIQRLEQAILADTELKKCCIIDRIISPLTIGDITGSEDTLDIRDLIETDGNGRRILPRTEADIAAFRERLVKNPVFRQGIYAVDRQSGEITDFAVIIKFAGTLDQEAIVTELIDITEAYGDLDIRISGVPYVNKKFNDYIKMDITESIPLVLLVMTVVFYLNFRSARGVLLPLCTLGMAVIWTIGLMGHLGFKITSVGGTMPPLLIAVGSSYAIHILNQYYNEFDRISGGDKKIGIAAAMSHISLTVFLAGFTTVCSFMTLVTNRVSAIQEWALFSALGISFAVLISITLIPAALALFPHTFPAALRKKQELSKPTFVEWLLPYIAAAATRHPKKVFAVTALVVLVAMAGALRLRVDTEFLHYFKENDPARLNVINTGEKFGGGWGFSVILDSNEIDGAKNPAFLNTVEDLRQWLTAEGNEDLNIGRTDAFPDFIKRMHMAMNNDDPAYFKIPENRMDIIDYLEIFSGEDSDSDGRVDDFEAYVDQDFQKNNILVRLSRKSSLRVGSTEIKHLVNKIETHLARTLPGNYSYSVTGYPIINMRLAHYVVMGQLENLALSLVMVVAVIIFLFRKLAAGPIALIDIGVTIMINFGIMGWFGIDLDMVTSIIASITVGIGVDDTIHFLNTYRLHKTRENGISECIEKTMYITGKAIIFTSLALILGFIVQATSNFLPVVLFSILIAITMFNTTIGSILLIPSAIRLTGIDLKSPDRGKAAAVRLSETNG